MSDPRDPMPRYAVAVIGHNIVIDCGTHDEAMRVVGSVTVSPRTAPAETSGLREALEALLSDEPTLVTPDVRKTGLRYIDMPFEHEHVWSGPLDKHPTCTLCDLPYPTPQWAHSEVNDPSGLYDDNWEPIHAEPRLEP